MCIRDSNTTVSALAGKGPGCSGPAVSDGTIRSPVAADIEAKGAIMVARGGDVYKRQVRTWPPSTPAPRWRQRQVRVWAVSYTHLDVYKRQLTRLIASV